jgi:hypothetical protein
MSIPWTWEHPKFPKRVIRFLPDGTARNTGGWHARWTISGIRSITLEHMGDGKKAELTFAPDLKSFQALHFDKSTVLTGRPATEAEAATREAAK